MNKTYYVCKYTPIELLEAFGILVDAEMREAFGLDEQEQIGPKLEM